MLISWICLHTLNITSPFSRSHMLSQKTDFHMLYVTRTMCVRIIIVERTIKGDSTATLLRLSRVRWAAKRFEDFSCSAWDISSSVHVHVEQTITMLETDMYLSIEITLQVEQLKEWIQKICLLTISQVKICSITKSLRIFIKSCKNPCLLHESQI